MLAEVEAAGAAEWWCLGDLVGYGAHPRDTLAIASAGATRCLAGNHDLGACGRLALADFANAAGAALRWTHRELGESGRAELARLQPVDLGSDGAVPLYHASARDPVWEYVTHPRQAHALLLEQTVPLSLHGHTHVPAVWRRSATAVADVLIPTDGDVVTLGEDRLLVNPGAVGQPRDADPRAAWALYDPGAGTIEFRRTEYDIAGAQAAIRAAGLPDILARRLTEGR